MKKNNENHFTKTEEAIYSTNILLLFVLKCTISFSLKHDEKLNVSGFSVLKKKFIFLKPLHIDIKKIATKSKRNKTRNNELSMNLKS